MERLPITPPYGPYDHAYGPVRTPVYGQRTPVPYAPKGERTDGRDVVVRLRLIGPEPEEMGSLKRLLKHLLRAYRLQCVGITEVAMDVKEQR